MDSGAGKVPYLSAGSAKLTVDVAQTTMVLAFPQWDLRESVCREEGPLLPANRRFAW